jgi:hypothetical protein
LQPHCFIAFALLRRFSIFSRCADFFHFQFSSSFFELNSLNRLRSEPQDKLQKAARACDATLAQQQECLAQQKRRRSPCFLTAAAAARRSAA